MFWNQFGDRNDPDPDTINPDPHPWQNILLLCYGIFRSTGQTNIRSDQLLEMTRVLCPNSRFTHFVNALDILRNNIIIRKMKLTTLKIDTKNQNSIFFKWRSVGRVSDVRAHYFMQYYWVPTYIVYVKCW